MGGLQTEVVDQESAAVPQSPDDRSRQQRALQRWSVAPPSIEGIEKALTGIDGLDEVTYGGLPRGRPTLICGGPGCGKTLLSMEFLVRGALELGEPGVLMTFEETADEIAANVASLGFDVQEMIAKRQLFIDHVHVERSDIEEAGEYNLDGLFIRIRSAIEEVGAKRIVLDTIESLFSGFTDTTILRAELRRLFRWLKDHGLTTIITGERGEGQLTRQGMEEYVSDCVILLDHRTLEQRSIRRLRIVKYRGSAHGTNEYPFLIDEHGFSVLPITTLGLRHEVSDEVVATGVSGIDDMLGPGGIYRGSSILVSGTAGTGKTSLGAAFLEATCRRKERALLVSYEESPAQIVRNMRSIGIDMQPWIDQGLLHIHTTRPSTHGLEAHLVLLHKLVAQNRPSAVVVDPVSSLLSAGTGSESREMVVRLIDFLKVLGVTGLYIDLTPASGSLERTEIRISSLIDTWLQLRQIEVDGERNRTLLMLKSRGMSHSNQVREFLIGNDGIQLRDAYLGRQGVLTGSARLAQEARDRDERARQLEERRRQTEQLGAKRKVLEAQMQALQAELYAVTRSIDQAAADRERAHQRATEDERAIARSRYADRSPLRSEESRDPP